MTHLKQSILTALAVVTVFFVGSQAACAETITEGFDSYTSTSGLPSGWDYSGSNGVIVRETDTYHTKAPCVSVPQVNTDTYLITPALIGNFSFWLRNQTKNYQASISAYACVYSEGQLTLGDLLGSKTLSKTSGSKPNWEQVTFNAPTGTRVALLISRGHLDDFTYEPYEASAEATLTVSGFASGSSYDFGTVVAGTTKTFSLWNGGLAELSISSITVTGDFTITAGADLTSLAPEATAEVTIATPDKDAEGVLTITSSDANSPYTISLKSTNKVAVPIMGVDPTTIVFGNVTADASQDVTVSNTGDAELTATIASSNTDFTVSAESLTVPAGESKTFTVTYHYNAEAYGGHAATITLTPNVGEAVTISVSASVKDPNAWSEDFSGNVMPEDWEIIGTKEYWSFDNGTAEGNYYEPNGYLVTPKLIVKEGESLTFQARSKQYNTDIKVDYQKDGGEWINILSENRNTQTEYETYTIGGLEAGTYRFRFMTDRICLDNFEGFQLAPSNKVKETWWVSYTFSYGSSDDNMQTEIGTEEMEVEIDGDDIAFKFPEPITGGTWIHGTKDSDGNYFFKGGQYIGQYGGDKVYFYGYDGESSLLDMVFYTNAESDSFLCPAILLNASTTRVSYYGIFTNTIVSKTNPETVGIQEIKGQKSEASNGAYNLSGQKVGSSYRGLVIKNGKKYIMK